MDRWAGQTLLILGIPAGLVYVGTDLLAGNLYPGYSFKSQAVSELFAIGAPTSRLVVPLFTLSSLLLACLAAGIWRTADRRRVLMVMAVLILANAIDSVVLWNFFPMHMRGDALSFTDQMHALLAINPFVLATIIAGALVFRTWFRWYSIATILLLLVPAMFAFTDAARYAANLPTPWLGITERVAQYSHHAWHAVLAVVLLRKQQNARAVAVSG